MNVQFLSSLANQPIVALNTHEHRRDLLQLHNKKWRYKVMETWKEIEGMPEYEVSTFGRVKSKKRKMEKILNSKYGQVMLYDEGYKMHRIHRLVARAFIPNPDSLPDVRHIDGNPSNNMVCNLEWFNQQLYRKQNVTIVPSPAQIEKLQSKYNFKILC